MKYSNGALYHKSIIFKKAPIIILKSSDLTRIPSNSCEVTDPAIVRKVMLLLEKLEEHDDVQNVYSNFEADEDLINQVSQSL